ncbi:hypothetical protein BU24DRAFT_112186 [Aaosphaeria arxii CBS 175.79]|uniref:Luciferase domain-containing protein n=1 Tax=Aaosphaeria arxii CBS 175.79 TaxID=1450172 RepID=A0A6A5Y0U0_9PLEO|nr:uncharacterized protein BU24DRAFT_112186 [Aaosphaeria arxii CBS 175.79]KAF2019082.1 hypothetical protein BU24DRAFT_112186 [Aaosphaeria arxii CBS 175.79]
MSQLPMEQPILIPSNLPSIFDSILTLLLTIVLPLLALHLIHHDYQSFLRLGPGGTPSTPTGYLKIKLLSILSLRDPLRPLPIPPHFRPQTGHLRTLPKRRGPRPIIAGIAPQRQQSQRSSPSTYAALVARLRLLAQEPRNMLLERTSCFEKHSSGLFARTPITRTCGGEICHAHPSDGSMHLTLHPADVKVVIEAGWGERHPLARGGWFRRFVPREFVLVYAPREEADLEVLMEVVGAAVWWVSGLDVKGRGGEGDGEGERRREADVGEIRKAREENECWSCRVHGCGRRTVEGMVDDA